jgi:hypothetical protein
MKWLPTVPAQMPLISYAGGGCRLSVVHCTAVDCSTHSSPIVLDSAAGAGAYTAMTIGADGLPIISYQGISGGNFNLSTIHCSNILCAPPLSEEEDAAAARQSA